ncbi:MAG: two-component system, NarL family, invasion response regulator UvrY [Solirubrobacteraceae bacterium]|jgi:DNA-binding NarL/FixJ family response regulator|nr:two-component system, NarL family, invasion response regulator UvrY [Solirubrobacteraceae bacterium]
MRASPVSTTGLIRVLTADDHPGFLDTARELIRRTPGFETVGEARSGEQAVTLAWELRAQLVLLDVHMPGIGGIEASRQIVAANPEVVVALISAYAVDDLPSAVLSCGARAVLAKHRLRPQAIARLWDLAARTPAGTVLPFDG